MKDEFKEIKIKFHHSLVKMITVFAMIMCTYCIVFASIIHWYVLIKVQSFELIKMAGSSYLVLGEIILGSLFTVKGISGIAHASKKTTLKNDKLNNES